MKDAEFPLIDANDHLLLMHRDAHFDGKFILMLDYYKKEGKGVQEEIDIKRIEELASLEDQLKQNLSTLYLSTIETEKIADSHEAYQKLRTIAKAKKDKNIAPQLIAALILSEEENPRPIIEEIFAHKEQMVQALIDLLRSEHFYDPLFPGFGLAPFLAAQCLGEIGDKRAIISLFEALGLGDFFSDEQVIKALKAIGQPAKEFLLHVLHGKPINEDNEKAAIALVAFKEDEEVANFAFDMLQEPQIQKDPCLPTYLVLISAGLKDPIRRQSFKVLSKDKQLNPALREDMLAILKDWEEIK